MTIIFGKGEEFWIEALSMTISLPDAAGTVTGAVVNLERPGIILHISGSWNNPASGDNSGTLGAIGYLTEGSLPAARGTSATGCRTRIIKTVGTAGATSVFGEMLVFMRKQG